MDEENRSPKLAGNQKPAFDPNQNSKATNESANIEVKTSQNTTNDVSTTSAEEPSPATFDSPTEPSAPKAETDNHVNSETDSPLAEETMTDGTTSANPEPQEVTVSTDDAPSTTNESTAPVATDNQNINNQPVVSPANHSYKGLIYGLIFLLLIAVLGVVGYIGNKSKTTSRTTAVAVKKDIPVLQVAEFSPLPHTYYPNIINDAFQVDVNLQLFEGLTKFVNDTTIVPNLADSWTNPDTSTWVFKLHPGVKFHTGKTMTASDVKGSIEAIEPTDYGKNFASTIKAVTVIDPLTVKITTNGPDPILANELANLFIFDTTSTKKDDPINGTGPYTLKSDTPDAIKLSAFDQYWGGHVYSREVDFLGYTDQKLVPLPALQNKSIQIVREDSSNPAFSAKLASYGYAQKILPDYSVAQLTINTLRKGSPFNNLKVRQAIAQAIDANAIIKAYSPGATLANQVIPKGIPGYNPNLPSTTYSAVAAKKALADAGYPNGFSFTLTYYTPAQTIADIVTKNMAAIGVTVKQDPESDQHNLVKIALGGNTDMFYANVSSSYVDASDIFQQFIGSPNYDNPALDKLSLQASQELNPTKRVAILEEISKQFQADQPAIPLYQSNAYAMANAPNVVYARDTIGTAIGVYFWQVYEK